MFKNGTEKKFDAIVFATGYRSAANKWLKVYIYILALISFFLLFEFPFSFWIYIYIYHFHWETKLAKLSLVVHAGLQVWS